MDDLDLDDEFLGIFEHTMDDKGRLVLPSDHRSIFGKETIHMTLGFDNIMTLHPVSDWLRLRESMKEMHRGNQAQRRLARSVFGNASKQVLDSGGRITINSRMREMCGFGKDIVIVGMNTYVEVWPAARWRPEEQASHAEYVNTLESVGVGSL